MTDDKHRPCVFSSKARPTYGDLVGFRNLSVNELKFSAIFATTAAEWLKNEAGRGLRSFGIYLL